MQSAIRNGTLILRSIALLPLLAVPTQAAELKIGLVIPTSGPVALFGDVMEKAAKLYMKEHGAKIGNDTLSLIIRDETTNPETAKRISQELLVRDRVTFLAGYLLTPSAFAVAPIATEANAPVIVMNAAASCITASSPNIVRTSFTQWQVQLPLARWAASQGGVKKAQIAISDYGPGGDAEAAFRKGLSEGGATVLGTTRMPLRTPDYAPYLQGIKDQRPEALFIFLGAVPANAFFKSYRDLALRAAGVVPYGDGGLTEENELPVLGAAALGVVTAMNYSVAHQSPVNASFLRAWQAAYGKDDTPNYIAVGVWDGMAAIYEVVRQAKGQKITGTTAMAALRNWQIESPRGPIAIDPDTRDIVQNIYIRKVEEKDGRLQNVEFATVPNVKDPGKELGLCK